MSGSGRPPDNLYYERQRVDLFSQGDIFRDVPLGYPTILEEAEDDREHDRRDDEWLSSASARLRQLGGIVSATMPSDYPGA